MTRIVINKTIPQLWNDTDPIVPLDTPVIDTTSNTLKVGDGVKKWSELSEIGSSFETIAADPTDATYIYTGDVLSQITYASGLVKSFSYTGDVLTSLSLTGGTLGATILTKTFNYTGDILTSTTYS